MRAPTLAAVLALLTLPALAHAAPACDDDPLVLYSRALMTNVHWRVESCAVAGDDDPAQAGVRVIPPQTAGVVLNYEHDFGPAVPTLDARLVGRGADVSFTLYRFTVGDRTLYGAGEKALDPAATDDLVASVRLPDGSVQTAVYRDAGNAAT